MIQLVIFFSITEFARDGASLDTPREKFFAKLSKQTS